jgi:hypothetical protein
MLDAAITLVMLWLVVTYVVNDIIKYAPGEKRQLDQERRARVHTRSHHYKLPRNPR